MVVSATETKFTDAALRALCCVLCFGHNFHPNGLGAGKQRAAFPTFLTVYPRSEHHPKTPHCIHATQGGSLTRGYAALAAAVDRYAQNVTLKCSMLSYVHTGGPLLVGMLLWLLQTNMLHPCSLRSAAPPEDLVRCTWHCL